MAKLQTLAVRAVSFCRDNSGQNLVEYALVVLFVAVGVIASARSVQTAIINATYNGISIVMASF